jgi:hypothetical protein
MKKIIGPGILAGFLILIVLMGQSYSSSFLFPSIAKEYNNTNLYRPWSDPAMWVIFVYPFFSGIALAWIWDKTKNMFKGKNSSKVVHFAFIYWIVAFVPAMIMIYSCMPVSLAVVSIWTVSGFIYGLIGGLIFSKLNPCDGTVK